MKGADTAWRTAKGQYYEGLALTYLRAHGLRLLQRNYRCKLGEIDLIMQDHGVLVFVEVRFRDSESHGTAFETVDSRKQRKLLRAAQHYLLHHNEHVQRICRFDVLGLSGRLHSFRIHWIRDAFGQAAD